MSDRIKIERWKQFWQTANEDSDWKNAKAIEDERRSIVQKELLHLLYKFMTDTITVEQFRSEFDSKTRTVWTVFGLKGLSGAMFLNKLVKFISDTNSLTAKLKAVLVVPKNAEEARRQLAGFMSYLNELIDCKKTTKGQLQPARASFFVSAWWHMQDVESWPIYYQSGRKALQVEDAFDPKGDIVEDYFAFHSVFNSLKASLELNAWQCEHLLDWCDQGAKPIDGGNKRPTGTVTRGGDGDSNRNDDEPDEDTDHEDCDEDDDSDEATEISHTQIQWLLAKIGHKFGCQVWIASNDQSKVWKGQMLSELSIKSLPTLGLDSSSQKIIGLIDVVWLKGSKQIAAAFEIEHTTSVYSGILRMSDLVALSPNLNFPLYLVAPNKRMEKVRRELSRPTFQTLELHKRCGYFSDESLVAEADVILKWATDVSAVERLASKVNDVPLE
jgi:hypothetical protein